MRKLFWSFLVFLGSMAPVYGSTQGGTELELNGEKALVYFNDGDTFKVLTGRYAGKRSRLSGFNALESFGPIHRWGSFGGEDLYKVASAATKNARRGGWHCSSDLSTDLYGRILSVCTDLALDQVGRGYGHVMSISQAPGDSELVDKQREAMQQGAGMWALGVPRFIVTSLHSIDENISSRKREGAYDRLVSTEDGHSVVVRHRNSYRDCEEVCYPPTLNQSAVAVEGESCLVYVSFDNRYGSARASCLK